MSVINLSEEYRKTNSPSVIDRIRMATDLDLYWASSLSGMEGHFQKNPPFKRKGLRNEQAAYVLFRDMAIKRMYPDDFEDDDRASLIGLDEGLCFPCFVIQDATRRRVACWAAGNSMEYLLAKKAFGFGNKKPVSIPKIFLQYNHDSRGGTLMLRQLCGEEVIREKSESVREKISRLITIPAASLVEG